MIKLDLYCFETKAGKVFSINKPNQDYVLWCRLKAEEGKSLTKDEENFYLVVDIKIEDLSNWKEVDEVIDHSLEELKASKQKEILEREQELSRISEEVQVAMEEINNLIEKRRAELYPQPEKIDPKELWLQELAKAQTE